MSPQTKQRRKVKRTIKKRINKLGEREFLRRLLKDFKMIYWIVVPEELYYENMQVQDIQKYCIQNKVLSVVLKYLFRSYGIPISVPFPSKLEMDYKDLEDWDIAFSNMSQIGEMGNNFNYSLFTLYGFESYFLGADRDEVNQSIKLLPKIINEVTMEKTQEWLEYTSENIFCYLLYHPCYSRFCNWKKENIIGNEFDELYRLVEKRLSIIHNCSLGILMDSCADGAAFPIYYHDDDDYLFSCDETTFHIDSLFAAFVLQCLIAVAERNGFLE